MTARAFVILLLLALGAWATAGSRAGSGAQRLTPSATPRQAIAEHRAFLAAEAARQARLDQDRRYAADEMGMVERMEYEAMLERERYERERAAAAAARAAYIRNTRRTGGGPSGGK